MPDLLLIYATASLVMGFLGGLCVAKVPRTSWWEPTAYALVCAVIWPVLLIVVAWPRKGECRG